jgi:putative salt-induced outer membrane protein YdiY
MKRSLLIVAAAAATICSSAFADTVVLSNGDTLNGTIGLINDKEMKFTSPAFGEITIPLDKITKYEITAPARVQPRGQDAVTGQVSGDATTVTVDEKKYDFTQLKYVNPPAQEWNGALIANFSLARGNTNKFTVGFEAKAALFRDDAINHDRTTFGGAYNYGESGGGAGDDDKVTDTDNWNAFGQYDRYWTELWYGYAALKIEHDRIAALDYRVAPGVGVGYQWLDTAKVAFRTEAGVTYIHEEFKPDGSNDSVALRLAYTYTNKLSDTVTLFHNLEYLPAFDDPSDYILNADIGLRAALTDNFFAQGKIAYKRDSTPAPDSLKDDLLYTIGVGWSF